MHTDLDALLAIDHLPFDDGRTDPTFPVLVAQIAALTPGSRRTLDSGASVTALEEGGYLVHWPENEEGFRALEAEGAAFDALAYAVSLPEGTPEERLVAQKREFERACAIRRDLWIPANGGAETPTRYRSGHTLLYCFNPYQGRHAYLDCASDMILADEEALQITF